MKVPARLAGVPRILLDHAYTQTGGDFSRVRMNSDGTLDILNYAVNHPPDVAIKEAVRPAGAARKKAVKKTAPPRKKVVVSAPKPVASSTKRVRRPVQSSEPHLTSAAPPRERAPEPVQVRESVVEPPKVADPKPTTTLRAVKDQLLESERRFAESLKQAPQEFDRPIPPEFDIREAWEKLDVDRVASSMLKACKDGLPESLPLDMHADVLALEGIQFDIVAASVRNPQFVEIAGTDTKAKGFPVLRFYRGDVMTVVGLREAMYPLIIATYVHSQLEHDTHRVGRMGGGGARKATGLPGTPALVAKRLRSMGAEVAVNELSDAPALVVYRGQELGKISQKGDKKTCESDYQRMTRKMEAINRRG